jgi:hypothetical protein
LPASVGRLFSWAGPNSYSICVAVHVTRSTQPPGKSCPPLATLLAVFRKSNRANDSLARAVMNFMDGQNPDRSLLRRLPPAHFEAPKCMQLTVTWQAAFSAIGFVATLDSTARACTQIHQTERHKNSPCDNTPFNGPTRFTLDSSASTRLRGIQRRTLCACTATPCVRRRTLWKTRHNL